MELSNAQRAEVLIHALPYIQKYYNKIIVVKYGGNAMINEELKKAVMGDIVLLSLIGIKVVLVHGGGPEISEMLQKIGKRSEFVNGLRVTDAETAEVVQMPEKLIRASSIFYKIRAAVRSVSAARTGT